MNSGICMPTFSNSSNSYVCVCALGYTGEKCETRIDPCQNKCLNGGMCQVFNSTSFKCVSLIENNYSLFQSIKLKIFLDVSCFIYRPLLWIYWSLFKLSMFKRRHMYSFIPIWFSMVNWFAYFIMKFSNKYIKYFFY